MSESVWTDPGHTEGRDVSHVEGRPAARVAGRELSGIAGRDYGKERAETRRATRSGNR
jgi:hypothetical protein